MHLILFSTRASANLGQADPVPLLPSQQSFGEDQSGSTSMDGTSYGNPDVPINLVLYFYWLHLKVTPHLCKHKQRQF